MDAVEKALDEFWGCERPDDLRVADADLGQGVAVVGEWVEVGGGFGVAEVVGPSPWCGADVGVDEVGVGSMIDEETRSLGVVGFGGVVERGLGAGPIVDVEAEFDQQFEHVWLLGGDVLAEPWILGVELGEQVGLVLEKLP